MGMESKKLPPIVIVSLSIVITLIYMSFVYKTWANVEDLSLLIPSFLAAGLSIGLFLSILPLKRPMLFSFCISALAPVLSGIIYILLDRYISDAIAGVPGFTKSDVWALFAWLIIISIVFGFVSMFGCYLGLVIKRNVKSMYLSLYDGPRNRQHNNEIKAAQIGSAATIAASIISAFASASLAIIS